MRRDFGWGLSAAWLCVALDLAAAWLGGWRWRADYGWLLAVDVLLMAAMGVLLAAPGLLAARGRSAWAPMSLSLVGAPLVWPALEGSWSLGLLAASPLVLALGWLTLSWRRKSVPLEPAGWLLGWGVVAAVAPVAVSAVVPGAELVRPLPGGSDPLPNVIVVVMDAVRADHLELYGYDRKTMPWLAEFAETSTVYEPAWASSSWTRPSHATLFTGLYPPTHGADYQRGPDGGWDHAAPLPESALTLAERLGAAGYQTAGFCGNAEELSRQSGLSQGFGVWVDARPQPSGPPVGARLAAMISPDAALELQIQWKSSFLAPEINGFVGTWLSQAPPGPKLLFINYMEAHAPTVPLRPHREAFPLSWGPAPVDGFEVEAGIHLMTERERQGLRDAYDAQLVSLDHYLSGLFGRLGQEGLLNGAMVVITSDHGEGLGEHGDLEHSTSLFDSQTSIPMIVRYPGQTEGRREIMGAGLVDVLPTILRAIGRPAEDAESGVAGMQGIDLQRAATRTGFGWLHRSGRFLARHPGKLDSQQTSAFDGTWKLVRWGDGSFHLYDWARDPGEKFDVADQNPEMVAAYREALVRKELSLGKPLSDGPVTLSPEDRGPEPDLPDTQRAVDED